ncbi:iron dependent repressor, N-terminal DNA binding domain protein [[Clostridium] bifermentans ATCC 638]|uniref:Manganese transport regulator n=1 Tax=Paraclostridium bifermentans ATCC 638 = DSM 14991 TaxID=1233171 RepID=T4VIB5_PARBF|nr:iron dependent repressor, metal binding and dimerization domain protein [Paraclostridium bifermentans]EQK43459.1 iron dependent repressor, N-terminal DNA binding domain protein [[Clostridium] bifermentans ATCC 638] [Paraclostridium bifermentans ATCC 638 = DSM 14991]
MKDLNEFYTFKEYMKDNSLSPNEEDYIEMIYRLKSENENVKIKDLSKALNIKPSSVSNMVRKLQEKNLLTHELYGAINLSDLGEDMGKKFLERHNTIYKFLKLIGLDEYLHEETEKIEHTISLETLVKINNLIDFFQENKEVLEMLKAYQDL